MESLTLSHISFGRPTELHLAATGPTAAVVEPFADELLQKLKDANGYEPALKAVHSRGRGIAQRILSAKAHREHHLLSRNERGIFLLADFEESVSDIREQFSIPIALTDALATQVGIRHPRFKGAKVALTTDFVFSLGNDEWVAVDFKQSQDLTKWAREKLRLAAIAFDQVGVTHFTVTEKDVPYRVIQNLRWLHIYRLKIDPPPVGSDLFQKIEPQVYEILSDGAKTVFDAARLVAKWHDLDPSVVARTCYWLIANCWAVDIRDPIGPDYPVRFAKQ